MRGSGGDDIIAIRNANVELVQGGNGVDTLRLDNGLDLDLTNISNLKIRNIESINMRNAGAGSWPIIKVMFGEPEIDGAAAIKVRAVTSTTGSPVKGRMKQSSSGTTIW